MPNYKIRWMKFAPDVSRLSWGHKYFSLIFPDKLDDLSQSASYQRFHLSKAFAAFASLGDGRYICAGRFFSVAQEVGSFHPCRLPSSHFS